jgi:uncharacterized Zn finger protein
MMEMTSEEYAKTGGGMCPFCGGATLEGHEVEIQEGKAWQRVDCDDCGKSWADNYVLKGYTELEP